MVAIDEFSALGGDQVAALFARGRAADLCALVATQELVDLERAARGLRDQILGNTTIKFVHRQDVPQSALTVAEMIGTEMVWEETRHLGAPFGYDTGRGTRRQVERFVVHPNEIKTLPRGEAVVIAKDPVASTRIVRVTPPATASVRPATSAERGAPPPAGPFRPRRTTRAASRAPARSRLRPRAGERGPELG